MGTRSCHTRLYGVHIERKVDPDRLVAFLRLHRASLDLHPHDLRLAESDPDYVESYEGKSSEAGAAALLADAINSENGGVRAEAMWSYDDADPFLGIPAESLLPWEDRGPLGTGMDKEEFEALVRRYVEELYGSCPAFEDHEIEQYG